VYSFGSTSSSDRALGAIPNSSTSSIGSVALGVQFQNQSNADLTLGTLAYTGEQWRDSHDTNPQLITVWYRRGFTSYTDLGPDNAAADSDDLAIWTELPSSATFTSPVIGGSTTALDGNASGNRAAITVDLSSITLKNGEYITFRFKDSDIGGSGGSHSV